MPETSHEGLVCDDSSALPGNSRVLTVVDVNGEPKPQHKPSVETICDGLEGLGRDNSGADFGLQRQLEPNIRTSREGLVWEHRCHPRSMPADTQS